jgi:hypothetical protein
MKHLSSTAICRLALQLDEDVYGDFDDIQIRHRLMEAIVSQCNYHLEGHSGTYDEDFMPMSVEEHASKPALTLNQAARMIISVWESKDRDLMEIIGNPNWPSPLPSVEELERRIASSIAQS